MINVNEFIDFSDNKSFRIYKENSEIVISWLSDSEISLKDKVILTGKLLRIITENKLYSDFFIFEIKIKQIINQIKGSNLGEELKDTINYILLEAANCCYETQKYLKVLNYLSGHKSTNKIQNQVKYLYLSKTLTYFIKVGAIINVGIFLMYVVSIFLFPQINSTIKFVLYGSAIVVVCTIFYNQTIKSKT